VMQARIGEKWQTRFGNEQRLAWLEAINENSATWVQNPVPKYFRSLRMGMGTTPRFKKKKWQTGFVWYWDNIWSVKVTNKTKMLSCFVAFSTYCWLKQYKMHISL
jgi:hypothetical protein